MKDNTKKKNGKASKYFRITVQTTFFLFLPSLFISIFQSMNNIFTGIFHQSVTLASLVPDIILLLCVSGVTALAGRFFCGWMCAFGSMEDLIYGIRLKITKRSKSIPKNIDMALKSVKYVLLLGIIVFVWGMQMLTVPTGVSPWDMFGMLLSFGNWPSISELAQGWIPAVILLIGIIVGSFMVERFFCRYLCPLGAYFSIICKLRPLIIVKQREECGACSLCTKKCSMGIDLNSVDNVHSGECINCMACVNNCPRTNTHLEVADVNINGIVASTASCALVVGAVYLGSFFDERLNSSNIAIAATVVGEAQSSITSAAWVDGTYEGTGTGFRGETTVSVTVSGGIITDIQMVSTNDDAKYINSASNVIISDIISTQSSDVDTVSGATYSSNAIIEAVKNALSGAASENSSIVSVESETEVDQSTSTPTEQAEESTPAATETDATQESATDTTTSTESGTLAGVEDGTYEGTGTGFRGDTTVSVTVSGGQITDIEILSYQDDQEFFERAIDTVVGEIISNQDVNVDAVSGATYSSNGIMGAVADALSLDYTQPVVTRGRGRRH